MKRCKSNNRISLLLRSSSSPKKSCLDNGRYREAINFKTVAEEAGVSKATLYNNDVLKERISGLRAVEKGSVNENIVAPPKDKIQALEDKIKRLCEEVKTLKEEKKKLVVQLIDMEELKDENRRLKEQIARLKS